MTTPSAEERAAWRALAEGATAGPWEVKADHLDTVTGEGGDPYVSAPLMEVVAIAYDDDTDNAAFIAATREGWTRTLDEVERLEAELVNAWDTLANRTGALADMTRVALERKAEVTALRAELANVKSRLAWYGGVVP